MNDTHSRRSPIGRILVALDASSSSVYALHAAIDLAGRFNAQVLGLFVEDINLLRLAELPFAREISFYGPGPREINSLEMALQLRIQADRIRSTLAQIADRYGIAWEFRTARGDVGAQVLSAAADIDLVVLGKIGRSLPGTQRTGSTVRALLMQRQGMTLILQTRVLFAGTPLAVVYDGSPAAGQALETAGFLAKLHDTPMIVFVIGDSSEAVESHREQARALLRSQEIEARFRAVLKPTSRELAECIQRETPGPVILPCLEEWFGGDRLCGLIDEMVNPVLLIR